MPSLRSPQILQCDGAADDDESSGDEDTSETSVDASNDEEEDSEESSDSGEEEEEEVVGRKNTKRSSAISSPSVAAPKKRLTRQNVRDQQPTKRLLRSRKKSPVAGAGTKQSQVFKCPNCKKEFGRQMSVNRHLGWCKPRTPKKNTQKDAALKDSGTPTSRKRENKPQASTSTAGETPTSGQKKRKGRPKKNAQNIQESTVPEGSYHQNTIPEDDFMLQRSPESSPGVLDTSSESDYEQREFAANVHHLNSNRSHISIDVENPDPPDQVQGYVYSHPNSRSMIMEMGQQEIALPVEGPVTCPKCDMTYRTRHGYENHFQSCMAYSSTSEEDEDVDVVADDVSSAQWGQGQTVPQAVQNISQDVVSVLGHASTFQESKEEESSEEVSSSDESQGKCDIDQVQISQVPDVPIPVVEDNESNLTENGCGNEVENEIDMADSTFSQQLSTQQNESPPAHLPIDKLAINHCSEIHQVLEGGLIASSTVKDVLPEPPVSIPQPPQIQTLTLPPASSLPMESPSPVHLPQQFPPTVSNTDSSQSPLPQQQQQPQCALISVPSTSSPPANSLPLLHHALSSSNTPTYTQAQLTPATVLHSSMMQPQHQMSTSAPPPLEVYQPVSSQASVNISQIHGGIPQQHPSHLVGPRPPLNGIQGMGGSYQLPQQLQLNSSIQQSVPPQIPQPQQLSSSGFPNVPPHDMQQQLIKSGGIIDQRVQPVNVHHQLQQPSIPQVSTMSGIPSGQFQNNFPSQFQFPNGGVGNPYQLNMLEQQSFSAQLGNHLQTMPNQLQQQQGLSQQQPISVPHQVSNLNPMDQPQSQQIMTHQQQLPLSSDTVPPFQQQNQTSIPFQYVQQQQFPKLIPDQNSNSGNVLQHAQTHTPQGYNNGQQLQVVGGGPLPTSLSYQIPQQGQSQMPSQVFYPQQGTQQQAQALQSPAAQNQQMVPQILQHTFQNGQIIPGQTPPEVQQLNNLHPQQQQQQLFQMQQFNQSQLQYAQKTGQLPQTQVQSQGYILNPSGLQWNRPGLPLIQSQPPQPQQQQFPPKPPINPQLQQSSQESAVNNAPQQQQKISLQQPQPQLLQNHPSQQQITQVIQQIAQITDGSGNTYIIVAPTPAQQQNGGLANVTANTGNVLNVQQEAQNVHCIQQPQVQQAQQQSPQLVSCDQPGQTSQQVAQPSQSSGAVRSGRSGPCPCPSCKEKLEGSNVLDRCKKVLPYPSTPVVSHSPTDKLKPILPNLSTRPILIRPAGTQPAKTIRMQNTLPVAILQQPAPQPQQQQLPQSQLATPMRMVPLAAKPATSLSPSSSTAILQQQPMGIILDGSTVTARAAAPISSSNIAVVRPMENPLQKLTDQISQIESSFLTPPHQQHLVHQTIPHSGSPQPPQQAVGSPNLVPPPQPSPVIRGPHLTLVSASPPPTSTIQSTTPPVATHHSLHLATLPPIGSPTQQLQLSQPQIPSKVVQNLQPRLMLVDHGSPSLSSPNKSSTPTSTATTPVRTATMAGVKRKCPGTPETSPSAGSSESSNNKSIKVTLKRKEGGDSYSINRISGSASASGTMKSLKIKGQIKSGEQAGTSTDVVVVPCIHTIPVPDPDADDAGGNRTIPEDETGDGADKSLPPVENGNGGHSSKARLMHRAVIVYEVQSNDTVLFRSSDVRAVWGYIFETVQGTRLNHNLPPLPYPATNISLQRNDPEADAAFNKLGLTHRAVQFLLEQLPGIKASSVPKQSSESTAASSSKQPAKTTESTLPHEAEQVNTEEEEELGPENESGCTRTERFLGRKPFDMFGWLGSKHRKPTLTCNLPMESATSLSAPLGMRFRKLKEKREKNLVVWWSTINGRGLYTKRDIEKAEMIIEYAGEVIRPAVCDIREKYYEAKSMGCYMFRINNDHVIDATMKGNAARFINHSCEPNCEAKAVKISGKDHILIFALRRITRGEELTYDYKFEKEEEKIPCSCGSKHCRKYLN